MRQAALGAVHAPNENMLTYQCITLGATVVLPCLCTTVEVAAIRQGAGEWAVRARPTGDTPAPPGSLGFLADLRVAVLDGEFFFTEVAR